MVDCWRVINSNDCHAGRMTSPDSQWTRGERTDFARLWMGREDCPEIVDLAWCIQNGPLMSSFYQADAEVERYNNTERIVDSKRERGRERSQ